MSNNFKMTALGGILIKMIHIYFVCVCMYALMRFYAFTFANGFSSSDSKNNFCYFCPCLIYGNHLQSTALMTNTPVLNVHCQRERSSISGINNYCIMSFFLTCFYCWHNAYT